MKFGRKRDPNGRLDGHMRESDNRAKTKKGWLHEVDNEFEADFQEDLAFIRHCMFGD